MLTLVCVVLIGCVYYGLTQRLGVSLMTTLIMLVMAFFFTAVASYIVGLVGNSNSPVSGMTITAVLFTGGLLVLFGFSGTTGMLATLGVAAIVCCTACTAGDVCNDLKTGSWLGATPGVSRYADSGVAVAALSGPVLRSCTITPQVELAAKSLPLPRPNSLPVWRAGFLAKENCRGLLWHLGLGWV